MINKYLIFTIEEFQNSSIDNMRAFAILLFSILCNPVYIYSQNLISNPSFEENRALDNRSDKLIVESFTNVTHWKLLGWQSFYCHCDLVPTVNWYISNCKKHLFSPRTGCAMIKMVYEENCFADRDIPSGALNQGCASYIESKFTETLEIGEVYEISFWVYFPKDTIVEHTIQTHIGFLPALRYISMSNNNMISVNRFFHDSIPFDKWFQIKKYIRALCPLNYLLIGAFKNDLFPTVHRHNMDHYPFYYIDDVLVAKVNEDTLSENIIPTPFCKFYDDEENKLDVPTDKKLIVFFDSDVSDLNKNQKIAIDSFIGVIESKMRPIYSIIGHTDNTGSENPKLASARAGSIDQYIQASFSIPSFRTVCFGADSSYPIAPNETFSGRSQNRRVEIKITSLSNDMANYREFLQLIAGNEISSAIPIILRWISAAPYHHIIYLLFDVRIAMLKNTKYWNQIKIAIMNRYRISYKSKDAFYLDSLRCEDQRYRTLASSVLNLSGFFNGYEHFNFNLYSINDNELIRYDSNNVMALTEYLKKNEFPKLSEIGRRNVEGLIFILIHSGNSELISKYLPIIKLRCEEGEAEWFTYAMLTDKYCVLNNLSQQFGTQFYFSDNEEKDLILAPFDDIETVNLRRKKIGLTPININEKDN